ncbi:MAG: LysR family transcriptional regulator [Bauldia sp.]|nr:LysR family transcriptional regulator [Bauldia sp.]
MKRSIDLQLLHTLQVLLTESSVSRTAEILGQSQPAVSASLKRLRSLLDDPLLVRSGSRLVPTERGLEILGSVARVLGDMETLLEPSGSFDPTTSERAIRIVAANCFGIFFVPRIISHVTRAAPRISLDICTMPSEDALMADLEKGAVDLVIGNWPDPPEALRTAPLLETDIVSIVRAGHPLARRQSLGMEEYLRLGHVSPSSSRVIDVSPIDGRLAQLRLSRNIVASVPEYAIAPRVVRQTDLVFTTGRMFAEALVEGGGFALIDAPPELGRMNFYLLWHERAHASPANRWLRGIVRGAAAEIRRAEEGRQPAAMAEGAFLHEAAE